MKQNRTIAGSLHCAIHRHWSLVRPITNLGHGTLGQADETVLPGNFRCPHSRLKASSEHDLFNFRLADAVFVLRFALVSPGDLGHQVPRFSRFQ